jgi:hypothetical protein
MSMACCLLGFACACACASCLYLCSSSSQKCEIAVADTVSAQLTFKMGHYDPPGVLLGRVHSTSSTGLYE